MLPGTIVESGMAWLDSMPPEFLFLLALPFIVAFAGLWAERSSRPGTAVSRVERVSVPTGFGTAVALLAVAVD